MKRRSVIALVALGILAGCAGCIDTESAPAVGELRADAMDRILDTMLLTPCDAVVDASTPGTTSENLVPLAQVAFEEGEGAEIDIAFDPADPDQPPIIAVGRKGAGGFDLFDMTDPAAPLRLSQVYHPDGFDTRDLKFGPRNETLYVATSGLTIETFDVRDPTDPTLTSITTIPEAFGRTREPHMIWTHRIADTDWVFMAPLSGEGIWVYEVSGSVDAPVLTHVAQTADNQGGPLGPHDVWITYDEVAGAHWMYVADGTLGWSVWDVDDPRSPQMVAIWPNLDPYQGYVHTVQAQWIDGRRIVATMMEIGHDALKLYDATDITAPLLLATWQQDPLLDATTPQHNLQLVDGRLYMAHYTRGLFIFDITDLPTTPLTGVGGGLSEPISEVWPIARLASNATAGIGPASFREFWDIVLIDGILYTADYWGLHVLGFGCLTPGDPTQTSNG